jgi:hypothetical protein
MLFIDHRGFETVWGIHVGALATKHEHNAVLVPDHPIEGNYMSSYASAIRRSGNGLS